MPRATFDSGCPACGAPLMDHHRPTKEVNEWWSFGCGGQIVRVNGRYEENEHCRDALQIALDELNAKTEAA